MDIFLQFLPLTFAIFLFIGIFVYCRNPHSNLNRTFACLCLSGAIIAYLEFGFRMASTFEIAYFWLKLSSFWPIYFGFLLHFVLLFTEAQKILTKKWIYYVIYLPPFTIAVIDLFTSYGFGKPIKNGRYWSFSFENPMLHLLVALVILVYLICIYLCVSYYRREKDLIKKIQTRYILAGISFSALGMVLLEVFSASKIYQIPDITMLCTGITGAFFCYALCRYEFLNLSPTTASKSIIENMLDGLILISANKKIVMVNQSILDLLQYEKHEVVDLCFEDIFFEKNLHHRFQDILETNGFREVETLLRRKDGKEFPVSLSTSVISYQKQLRGVICLIRDISEKKKAEKEKEKLHNQLLHAQKMEAVGTLAGGVAHDFNNLLTLIMGYSEMLLEELEPDDPIRRDIQEIYAVGKQGTALTRQLLEFSRKRVLQTRHVELNEIVIRVQTLLRRLLGENIELQTKLLQESSQVKADPSRIEQVIFNLAVNARDAMSEGGKLTIETQKIFLKDHPSLSIPPSCEDKEFICLYVKDSGGGISKDLIPHIFEPFFSTKKPGKGTGLGLAVVYSIIKQHKGWIHVASSSHDGTIFKIYLPFSGEKGKEKISSKPSQTQRNYRSKGERILVIEDDPNMRKLATKVLEKYHYIVFSAENAMEAEEIFAKEKGDFDLVFSDVILPDITGIELVELLLQKKKDLKILLTSGYTMQKEKLSVIQERGYPFLQKPYDITDLLANIRRVIGKGIDS